MSTQTRQAYDNELAAYLAAERNEVLYDLHNALADLKRVEAILRRTSGEFDDQRFTAAERARRPRKRELTREDWAVVYAEMRPVVEHLRVLAARAHHNAKP